jgi:CheY-like chemotaxis protein
MNKLGLVPGGVDAAIMDLGLPDRRGDALVMEVRGLYPSLPIVLATGQSSVDVRDAFRNDPQIAFVSKPYTSETLLRALRNVGIVAATTDS